VAKDWLKEIKEEKFEKPEKPEKAEKNEKLEKPDKLEKEKFEKLEHDKRDFKDIKVEKIETDGVFDPRAVPDPRIEHVIAAVAGLTKQVAELSDQLRELQKGGKG
jgi:hypothetical protein